ERHPERGRDLDLAVDQLVRPDRRGPFGTDDDQHHLAVAERGQGVEEVRGAAEGRGVGNDRGGRAPTRGEGAEAVLEVGKLLRLRLGGGGGGGCAREGGVRAEGVGQRGPEAASCREVRRAARDE